MHAASLTRRLLASGVALALVVGACTSGGGEAERGGDTEPPPEITGPIVEMVMAPSANDQGDPIDPSFTFPPDEKRITLLVQVGEISGSPLEMTWYRLTDGGQEELFSHTVEVASFDVAFSEGRNRGTLAAGSYRIVASVEGQTEEVEWDVDSGSTEASAEEATAGQAPTSGNSGTYALSSSGQASANRPIRVHPPTGSVDSSAAILNVVVSAGFESFETQDPVVVVDVFANGVDVGGGSFSPGDFGAPPGQLFVVDPCGPGDAGSDLPGTRITVNAFMSLSTGVTGEPPTEFGTVRAEYTLGDDTLAPRVTVNSSPPSGARVEPGDTIGLDATSQERRRNGPWQTGIQIFQLIGPDGVIGDAVTNAPPPKPCGQKDWSEAIQTEYTVPENAPTEFQICGIAEDYVGNGADRLQGCATFYTGEVWKGKLVSITQIPAGRAVFEATVELVVSDDGMVTGTASGTYTRCTIPNCFVVGGQDSLTVSGTRDASGFHITLTSRFGGPFAFDVPVEGTTATGTHRGPYGSARLDLTCVSCEEAVG